MADQGEVWAQLACRADELDVDSPTGAIRDLYASHATEMAAARQALGAQPGQVGVLIYMGTRWVGLDLLAGPLDYRSLLCKHVHDWRVRRHAPPTLTV